MFYDFSRLMYSTAGEFFSECFEKEDVVQQALLRLIGSVEVLRTLPRKALASYIVVTVNHTAINHLRKSGKTDRLILDIYDCSPESIPDEYACSLDERIIRSDNIGNYTDAELAGALGCKENSVRMKLTRARRHAPRRLC